MKPLRQAVEKIEPASESDDVLAPWPLLGFAWAEDVAELRFLIRDYLEKELKFLANVGGANATIMGDVEPGLIPPALYKITPAGWEQLQRTGIADSASGFVAMWFDGQVRHVWEQALYPAIADAGYSPLRMAQKEHNNRIGDEINASIRGCRFVVADFTGGRGGVSYEAGFAGGLGKPVIWTVRRDQLDDVHFDTRQLNHIPWDDTPDGLRALRAALKNRIEATICRGPIRAEMA